MSENLPVSSLRTAFEIIEKLATRDGVSVSELASLMQRPKSTVYDHLVTLHELGYLVKRNGSYHLSSDFLRMGDTARRRLEIHQSAGDELRRLANETGEHASLTVEEHGKAVIIATEEGNEAIPVNIYNGIVVNMHTAASGKAILAHLGDDRTSEIVETHELVMRTENTITERDKLRAELAETRERGYALDDEERLMGMRSVAAPVIDRGGQVRGSLAIYGPTNRIDNDLFKEEIPELLMRSANIVEVLLNYD